MMETNLIGKEIVRRAYFPNGSALTLVGTIDDQKITYAWAMCSPKDQFSKKLGLTIARGRLTSHPETIDLKDITVPVDWQGAVMLDLLVKAREKGGHYTVFDRLATKYAFDYNVTVNNLNLVEQFRTSKSYADAYRNVVLSLAEIAVFFANSFDADNLAVLTKTLEAFCELKVNEKLFSEKDDLCINDTLTALLSNNTRGIVL